MTADIMAPDASPAAPTSTTATPPDVGFGFQSAADGGPLFANPEDVRFAYNMFLGREPENNEVLAEACGQPIENIVLNMLGSLEFESLLAGIRLPSEDSREQYFSASLAELLGWLQRQITASAAFVDMLRASQNWRETLLLLLEVELLAGAVPSIGFKPLGRRAIAIAAADTPGVARLPAGRIAQSPPAPRLAVPELTARIAAGRLFDARWYAAKYRLQFATPELALEDFFTQGVTQGREPNPLFDSVYYRAAYMSDNTTDEPPFFHYLRIGMDIDLWPNPLINPAWVRSQLERQKLTDGVLSAILHKCSGLLLDPHPCFSTRFYLRRYPDLSANRVHPLVHYLQNGGRERRAPHPLFWPDWFVQLAGPKPRSNNPLLAYLNEPGLYEIPPNPYFNPVQYLQAQSELKGAEVNPLQHYLLNAQTTPHSPNASLDMTWAREQYRIQLATLATDPLSFLLTNGNSFIFGSPARRKLVVNDNGKAAAIGEVSQKVFGTVFATSRRHRIAYLSHNLKIQGAQTSLFELASGMARGAANDVVVLAPDDGPMKSRYAAAKIGVHKYMLPVAGMGDSARYVKLFEAFKAQIRELDVDLLHGNTIQAYHAIAAASDLGIPTVWNIRESEEPASHFEGLTTDAQAVMRRAIGSPTEFAFVSRTTEKVWLDAYPALKTTVINNGLNYNNLRAHARDVGRATARAVFGVQDGEIVIFNVGTWTERKGQRDILQALRLVDRRLWPRLRVVLIGANESDYALSLKDDLADMPQALRERFLVYGESSAAADRAIVYSAYHAADIFAFTSRIESYPRVVNEALYFGLPIVTTPCFGVLEQLEPGVSGLFYEAGETAKLARHIEELTINVPLRQTLSENATHAAFRRVMQYDEMLTKYDGVYKRLIGE